MLLSKHKLIENCIDDLDEGSVVAISDFNNIALQSTVSKVLMRMCNKKLISKVCRGIFWKSSKSNEYPNTHLVAKALARENTWHVIPCGDTALYLFGLVEEKPKEWTYVSNGAYKKYKIFGEVISFKHTTGRVMNSVSDHTMMLIQVLKAYGKELISDDLLEKIRLHIKKDEWTSIINEAKYTTQWISETITRMFQIPETGYNIG